MPSLKFSHTAFITTLLIGVLFATTSPSWLTAWLGLELNLLSFIPLMASKSNIYSSDAAIKYFLIQALGSTFILIDSLINIFIPRSFIIITIALLLKLGAAPCHFWFPTVIQGIRWGNCIILITVQKIAPIILISYPNILASNQVIFISSILSAIAGGLGGLNQTLIRKILAYSSINHIAWILAAISLCTSLWTQYFIIYTVITLSITLVIYDLQVFFFTHITNISLPNPKLKLLIFLSLLSIGGLPPFLGFFPKLIVIQTLAASKSFLWLSVLLSSALVTLYYYLRVILPAIILSTRKTKNIHLTPPNYLILSLAFVNILPTFLPFLYTITL